LLDWLKEADLDRVGCFPYSPVEGAKANEIADPVPEDIQQERYERFMKLAAEISAARLQKKIGREMTVLIDEIDTENGIAVARSMADAPEIDGNVFIEGEGATLLKAGEFVKVRITDADEYDLYAEQLA
ncbi:MAG: TRAM domain-containing protein, partial [Moraxellaceae bacterium]